jgi:hypothetical protein
LSSQKLTQIIKAESFGTREIAVSPIKTKRDRLAHVWRANAKKAWETRKRLAKAREASAQEQAGEMGKEAA